MRIAESTMHNAQWVRSMDFTFCDDNSFAVIYILNEVLYSFCHEPVNAISPYSTPMIVQMECTL